MLVTFGLLLCWRIKHHHFIATNRGEKNGKPCARPVQYSRPPAHKPQGRTTAPPEVDLPSAHTLTKSARRMAYKTPRLHNSSFVSPALRLLPLHKFCLAHWPGWSRRSSQPLPGREHIPPHRALIPLHPASCFATLSSDMCSLKIFLKTAQKQKDMRPFGPPSFFSPFFPDS